MSRPRTARSGIARAGVLGVASLALLAGGCGRILNQFPEKRFAREHVPTPPEEPTFAPVVDQKDVNDVQMSGLPVGVQASFRREHAGAGITSVQQVPSGTGPMLYRINYVDGGVPQSVTYHDHGADMANAGREVVTRDDSGFPAAKRPPAKTTAAGTPAGGVN